MRDGEQAIEGSRQSCYLNELIQVLRYKDKRLLHVLPSEQKGLPVLLPEKGEDSLAP